MRGYDEKCLWWWLQHTPKRNGERREHARPRTSRATEAHTRTPRGDEAQRPRRSATAHSGRCSQPKACRTQNSPGATNALGIRTCAAGRSRRVPRARLAQSPGDGAEGIGWPRASGDHRFDAHSLEGGNWIGPREGHTATGRGPARARKKIIKRTVATPGPPLSPSFQSKH